MAELKTRPREGSVQDFLAGIKSLEDIQLPVLEELIRACVEHLRGGR